MRKSNLTKEKTGNGKKKTFFLCVCRALIQRKKIIITNCVQMIPMNEPHLLIHILHEIIASISYSA